jgi:hypothetical protein
LPRRTINGSPGLWTAPNSASAPPGALALASGVVIKRRDLIENIRPVKQYSTFSEYTGTFTGAPTNLTSFGSRLHMTTDAGKLAVETAANSAILNVTSTAFGTPSSGTHVFLEANGNLYVTTSTGLRKVESAGGTSYPAGIPRCLDVQVTLQTGTLLASTNSVATARCSGSRTRTAT